MKLTIGQKYYSNGDEKIAVELRKVKKDGYFTRKLDAKTEFIRNHYNRKDEFGPASFSCSDVNDMNREIFLKPSSIVLTDIAY